jgi:hypothetical protein
VYQYIDSPFGVNETLSEMNDYCNRYCDAHDLKDSGLLALLAEPWLLQPTWDHEAIRVDEMAGIPNMPTLPELPVQDFRAELHWYYRGLKCPLDALCLDADKALDEQDTRHLT